MRFYELAIFCKEPEKKRSRKILAENLFSFLKRTSTSEVEIILTIHPRQTKNLWRAGDKRFFTPFPPMLAELAASIEKVFDCQKGRVGMEFKLGGVRVQVHSAGREWKAFSRRGNEITHFFPEIGKIINERERNL